MVVDTRKDLESYLKENAEDGLKRILEAFAGGVVVLAEELRVAPLVGNLGTTEAVNVQQEVIHKMDKLGNDLFSYAYLQTGEVHAFISEEEEKPLFFGPASFDVYTDPVDGSSNLDVGVPVGTILAVYEHQGPYGEEEALLRTGREAVAAAYALYGFFTQIVLTLRTGVQVFTLDPESEKWYLTKESVKFPEKTLYASYNWMNRGKWPQTVPEKIEGAAKGTSGRYVGSLVADFHRNLLKGGFFCYPNKKLRLLYEAVPMALIIEDAGGAAYGEGQNILDIQPLSLHQRVGLYLGSKKDIKKLV